MTLKLKYADFQQITRSQSLCRVIDARAELERIALELLGARFPVTKGIRLLGISISALVMADAADTEQLKSRHLMIELPRPRLRYPVHSYFGRRRSNRAGQVG